MMERKLAAPAVARIIPAVVTEIKLIHKTYNRGKLFHEYMEQFDYSWFVFSRSCFFKDNKRFDAELIKMEYDNKTNELVVVWSIVKETQCQ